MFNKNTEGRDYKKELKDFRHDAEQRVAELKSDHKLELREKEFELKHFKDEEMKKLKNDLTEKERELAVLQKENEMLEKITDLNADVIDVKELVTNLINKLPEIKLNNLTINQEKE